MLLLVSMYCFIMATVLFCIMAISFWPFVFVIPLPIGMLVPVSIAFLKEITNKP